MMAATSKTGKFSQVPVHIAIVPDGNGRWAGQRGLPRLEGRHEYTPDEIAEALFTFTEWCVFTLSGT